MKKLFIAALFFSFTCSAQNTGYGEKSMLDTVTIAGFYQLKITCDTVKVCDTIPVDWVLSARPVDGLVFKSYPGEIYRVYYKEVCKGYGFLHVAPENKYFNYSHYTKQNGVVDLVCYKIKGGPLGIP